MNDLLHDLVDAGTIQFGLFDGKPFIFNFKLLPSYPRLLAHVAESVVQSVDLDSCEYLVCTREALPLGIVLSQQTGIPLIYANPEEAGVMSLAGAYDVGHTAVLVANTWLERADIQWVISRGDRVGLEINSIVMIVGNGDYLEVISLLEMDVLINQLVTENKIPPGQADAIRAWLDQDFE